MNKDYSIKEDPQYSCQQLRSRITEAVKRLRDETVEVKHPKAKQHLLIPVTGGKVPAKFDQNKTHYKFDAHR